MGEAVIVKEIVLEPHHASTGKTRHYADGALIGRPVRLIIVRFGDGYNLIHLDSQGTEMSDTFHESVDGAVGQAAFEFSIKPEEWSSVNKPYSAEQHEPDERKRCRKTSNICRA